MESPAVSHALVENHQRFLAFVERRVGRRDVAEEILQDAFVRGFARADSVRDAESATAWFYRLLRNAMNDHFRRESARQRAHEAATRELTHTAGGEAGIADDAELMHAVCACVSLLIDTLKPEYADALRKVELDGESVQAYAQACGITANNGGVRVHRAREALRKQLMRSCGSCATHGCLDCECPAPDPSSTTSESGHAACASGPRVP